MGGKRIDFNAHHIKNVDKFLIYCGICNKIIKNMSKYLHFKSAKHCKKLNQIPPVIPPVPPVPPVIPPVPPVIPVIPQTSVVIPTNESFGMTVEYVLCKLNNIDASILQKRIISNECLKLTNVLQTINAELNIREWIGGKNTHIDFICMDNSTLSVKSNYTKNGKVCPQTIGQPTIKSFIKHMTFNGYNVDSNASKFQIKSFINDNLSSLIPLYYHHLFSCDKLLWIYKDKNDYQYNLFSKLQCPFNDKLVLSKSLDNWNESCTVLYNGFSIGEFQIHNNRNCIKFRFYMNKLIKL
jgi:hypothetical protein